MVLAYSFHHKHWKASVTDFPLNFKISQLVGKVKYEPVCVFCVKVHAHVYKTNSQQLKETLVYMQVMTHLLSTCKLNCIHNVTDEGKQTTRLNSPLPFKLSCS